VPSGWLVEGNNEIILFETGGANATLTIELKDAHTYVNEPQPPQENCPAGFLPYEQGLWSNPIPCGVYPTPPSCTERDTVNNTMPLCAQKCLKTAGCLAFEISDPLESPQCWIFLDELKEPFVNSTRCLTCVLKQ